MSRLSDLGVRSPAAVIDAALAGLGAEAKKGELQGSALALEDPEPWPDPVDGADLLDELVHHAKRFIILPEGGAQAIALWAVHTYVFDTGDISPRLCISSPAPRCAKTRVLQVLQATAARPVPSANITAAALFRTVEPSRPTCGLCAGRGYIRTVDQMADEVARWYFAGGARAVGAPWATEPTMLEEVEPKGGRPAAQKNSRVLVSLQLRPGLGRWQPPPPGARSFLAR